MARKYFISAGMAFKAIRNQKCFDENSNLEIRAAIRVSMFFGNYYLINRTWKHKHQEEGVLYTRFNQKDHETLIDGVTYRDLLEIQRIDEENFAFCCMSLKFKCPQCHWDIKPKRTGFYANALIGGKVVCEECMRSVGRFVKHQLCILSKLAGLLICEREVDNEEYIRIERYAYRGFNRPKSWKDFASGGSGEGLSDEKHHRHIEAGNSSFYNSEQFFRTNLASTKLAFINRGRVIEQYVASYG